MNKKAATVIESKYKKVVEAQKEEKEGCDNLNEAIDNLKFEMEPRDNKTIRHWLFTVGEKAKLEENCKCRIYVSIKTLDKSNYQQQLKYHMEKSKAAT